MQNSDWFINNKNINAFRKLFLCLIIAISYLHNLLFRVFKKKDPIWLIGENRGDCVYDNGYYFFKYCQKQHAQKKIYFIINSNSPVLHELKNKESNIIIYGSFQHALAFSLSNICFYTHTYSDIIYRRIYEIFGINKKLVFLHHGVLGFKKFDKFYLSKRNIMDIFTVGNNLEAEILEKEIGVPNNKIKVTGYARYDYLNDKSNQSNFRIVYIPTFRDWIFDDFYSSFFYKNLTSLINNKDLCNLLEEKSITFNIYLHKYIQNYSNSFENKCDNIKILKLGETSPTQLISESNLMITDYSSVSWDFFYLNKPIIFYRFDLEEYSRLRGSYIPLDLECIGEIVYHESDLISKISEYAETKLAQKPKFQDYHNSIIVNLDNNNCSRIYEETRRMR